MERACQLWSFKSWLSNVKNSRCFQLFFHQSNDIFQVDFICNYSTHPQATSVASLFELSVTHNMFNYSRGIHYESKMRPILFTAGAVHRTLFICKSCRI